MRTAAYLRDRLTVARNLLAETGSVFVQIGDENVHRVRVLLDEVFGDENFVSQISFSKTTGFAGNTLSNVADHLLWYSKDIKVVKFHQLSRQKRRGESGATAYRPLEELVYEALGGVSRRALRRQLI